MMLLRVSDWAWLPVSEFSSAALFALKQRLTIVPKATSIHQTVIEPIELFRQREDTIGVPRSFFQLSSKKPHEIVDGRAPGLVLPPDVVFEGELSDDQAKALAAVTGAFQAGKYGGIVQAVPGWGKTVVGLAIWTALRMNALVVVQKEYLVDQWIDRVRTFVPNARIGRIQKDVCQYGSEFDISVALIQSLVARRADYPESMWKAFGLVIQDECVTGEAQIETESGPVPLRSIVENPSTKVLSFDGTRWAYRSVVRAWKKGKKDVVRVEMRSGRSLRATADHLVLTTSEWKKAGSLLLGDRIVSPVCVGIVPRAWDTSFDCVNRVVSDGRDDVFDIEVEGSHCFVANGLLVHNCHRVAAPTWASLVPGFGPMFNLGLSATPRRKDGADDVFFWHIGPVIYRSTVKKVIPQLRRVYTGFKIHKTQTFNPDKVSKEIKLRFICKSKERNQKIVGELLKAVRAGRKVILLSERVKHLEILREMFGLEKPENCVVDFFIGGRKRAELELASKANVLLCTYQMAKEALDIPTLDTLFLVTPVADVEQSVGRIMREVPGKRQPIVTDFIDADISMCARLWNMRRAFYVREGIFKEGAKEEVQAKLPGTEAPQQA